MTAPPPDGSRDRRIEDLSNLYLIHPAAQALVPRAIAWGVSPNAVSLAGLAFGIAAALCYARWTWWPASVAGFALSIAWLIADGLDGKLARATGRTSDIGRILDGVVDHGVFILLYVALAASLGTAAAWGTAVAAGACHALQSTLYEGERTRFHRRLKREPAPPKSSDVPIYDTLARAFDRAAPDFDALLLAPGAGSRLAHDYGERAAPAMRLMALESANVRVLAIFLACLASRPMLFWWLEIGPLMLLLLATTLWLRHGEARLVARWSGHDARLGRRAT